MAVRLPDSTIGPYHILAKLGAGGMGEVLLGHDPRLQRQVALKCLTAVEAQPGDVRARVLREARAAARLNHPNIAGVYDVLEDHGRTFIVMEYVEGETLSARLARGPLSMDEVRRVGRQLASALAAAHAQGVIHRDLKPANIQVAPDGSIKILDFGVAKLSSARAVGPDAPTEHATAEPTLTGNPGTLAYMSPEQLLKKDVDGRSDIYSAGVILFLMATGRRPFQTDDAVTYAVAVSTNAAPAATSVNPEVPEELNATIARALERDPRDRFQSAREFEDALAGTTVDVTRTSQSPRRQWTVAGVVAAGVGLLTIVVAVVGVATTVGFQYTFGLDGKFAAQSLPMYFVWGLRALFPSAFQMTLMVLLALGLRVVARLIEAIGPIGRAFARVRRSGAALMAAAGLTRPSMLAQALCALAIVGLGLIVWSHLALIQAWGALINSYSADVLRPLGPNHMREKTWYRTELDVLLLTLGFGFFKVLQWRRRERSTEGTAALVLLGVTMSIVVLMNEWPYRVFYHNLGERFDYGGERCYIIADSADEYLVFCPASAPPRNHVIRHPDPLPEERGTKENVFTVLDPAR